MNPLDQSSGTPILSVLLDLLASGISGFCLPPILCGVVQLVVAFRRPALLAHARWLTASIAVVATIAALGRAVDSPLGISSPASELTLYAHAFVYGLVPAFLAALFALAEASITLIKRARSGQAKADQSPA